MSTPSALSLRTAVLLAICALPAALLAPDSSARASGKSADAVQDTTICSPVNVGVFSNRVHVRCTTAVNGIIYFAVATSDANAAARALAAFQTAIAAGHDVRIYFDPADTSGAAFGCAAVDCRRATGIELL